MSDSNNNIVYPVRRPKANKFFEIVEAFGQCKPPKQSEVSAASEQIYSSYTIAWFDHDWLIRAIIIFGTGNREWRMKKRKFF